MEGKAIINPFSSYIGKPEYLNIESGFQLILNELKQKNFLFKKNNRSLNYSSNIDNFHNRLNTVIKSLNEFNTEINQLDTNIEQSKENLKKLLRNDLRDFNNQLKTNLESIDEKLQINQIPIVIKNMENIQEFLQIIPIVQKLSHFSHVYPVALKNILGLFSWFSSNEEIKERYEQNVTKHVFLKDFRKVGKDL